MAGPARLIEPLGLVHGPAAEALVRAGHAQWLAGGPTAFCLARLIGADAAADSGIVPVARLPSGWEAARARITTTPAPWAGLPTHRPLVMGILNVTPDSFSDGGQHLDPASAIAAGRAMVADGADILDIGGESTRPGAAPLAPSEEQARILPVITALAGLAPISVDTRHASTMAAALDAGAAIVNDVSALTHDPRAASLLAARGCPVILMHMRGTPATMAAHAQYMDPAVEITHELATRVAAAVAAGIAPENIAIDPGIGFAKNASQNRDVLVRFGLLANLGHRIVLGVSRKRMIGVLGEEPDAARRLPGSLAAALVGLAGAASILRVHDVAETVQAVRVWHGLVNCEVTG